jgi:hypothetical protein
MEIGSGAGIATAPRIWVSDNQDGCGFRKATCNVAGTPERAAQRSIIANETVAPKGEDAVLVTNTLRVQFHDSLRF